jgi:hypothetical protein
MQANPHAEADAGASSATPVTAIVLLALAGVGLRVTLAWDATDSPYLAFALIGLGAVVVMALTPTIDFAQSGRRSTGGRR